MSAAKRSPSRPAPRSKPTWDYDVETGILRVVGDSFYRDLKHVRELLDTGAVPYWSLDTIIHETRGIDVPMLMRGHILSEWIVDGSWPDWLWHFESQARRSA